MSKKKKEMEIDIDIDRNGIENNIYKKYKVNPNRYLNDIVQNPNREILNISPMIDLSCGGGIITGSTTIISGPPKIGKTTICLELAKAAQKLAKKTGKKRKIYYIDIENRLEKRDLSGDGLSLDPDDFEVVGSVEGQILSAEQVFQLIEDLARKFKDSIFFLDSLSMLCSEDELVYDFSKELRAAVPKMTAIFLRKMAQLLRPTNNTLVCIIHQHANQNARMPGSPTKVEGGGSKIQYASNYKFELKYKEDIFDSNDMKIGHKVHFKCSWHPADGSRTQENYFYHTFSKGLDSAKELADLARQYKLVTVSGAWIKLEDGQQFQGLDKFAAFLEDDEEYRNKIKKEINEIFS
jgi:RecA/RadA recombinase